MIIPWGFHPFPSRTRKLSPTGPIVLYAKVCGRVGRCRIKIKARFRNEPGLFRLWQELLFKGGEVHFEDKRIQDIDCSDPGSLYRLIVEDLCGEKYYAPCSDRMKAQLVRFLHSTKSAGLNYAQFNELLLLVDQDRVTPSFFEFFFKDTTSLEQLKVRIIDFRGFAILSFGNFRFAYKKLSRTESKERLLGLLAPFSSPSAQILAAHANRPRAAIRVEEIERSKTWCNGYIAKRKYEKEAKLIEERIKAQPSEALVQQAQFYQQLGLQITETQSKAIRNTDAYLTWDYMDVYVATSMRNSWEFEDTADFVRELFHHAKIKDLQLRYFDPTQSQCINRIDKGLVEALMLKRATCTVYMVQETDTLGKDSELASTLAQGKPVIAFIPHIEVDSRAAKLESFPLEFFKLRFQVLQAEGMFDDETVSTELRKEDENFVDTINLFLTEYDTYRESQPFSLWHEKEEEFKRKNLTFRKIARLLAILEKQSFDKRASILKDVHPLSLQVHLESGVSNGVLVVRSVDDCAQLLRDLVLNEVSFAFEFIQDKRNTDDKGVVVLQEKISKSPFRAVTQYEKLANSFWNFYLVPEHLNE